MTKARIHIETLIENLRAGDKNALRQLQDIGFDKISDEHFKKILPFIDLDEQGVRDVIQLIEAELQCTPSLHKRDES